MARGVNTFGNLGIGILTSPTSYLVRTMFSLTGPRQSFDSIANSHLAGEVNGRVNTRPGAAPLGTESQGEARLGLQIRASGLRFDFAGIKGLTSFSPRSGITVGVTSILLRSSHPRNNGTRP